MTTQSASIRTAAAIRKDFTDFFAERHGHTFVPSSPVVPQDDPTLLFTNAGMNQFKDVFLGHGERAYRRAVNSQKCIRAGGKHNDLEDVGKDTYHHTFFEMLGNWSFGDYFKEEAIGWAWSLLTEVWGIDPDRLYVTVFAGDEADGLEADTEAEDLWRKHVQESRISRWDRKDNFWEMGESGPCGPCSEIHYDGRPDSERSETPGAELVNREHPDVIEIWNLVFIQFNRGGDGALAPLPARHVDTGMGFERLVRVLQGKRSNYDTDLWSPIFAAISEKTGAHPYRGALDDPVDTAYRVIADHVRCLVMAIADGARPGNDGRDYVLRRILRRAVRHGHQTLGVEGPLLCEIVPAVVASLGDAFPELHDHAAHVTSVIRDEEAHFLQTLDRGLELFAGAVERAAASGATVLSAADAFQLHDTFGFPIDLTRVMAEERGIAVDAAGYDRLMEEARERSRRKTGDEQAITLSPQALASLRHLGIRPTHDEDKYHGRPLSSRCRAIWNGTDFDEMASTGASVAVISERTSFYAEQGGQVGDSGRIETDVASAGTTPARGYTGTRPRGHCRLHIDDVQVVGGFILHIGRVREGTLRVGDEIMMYVDAERRATIRANHTGTHLLNLALRQVLGDDVQQKGSLVAHDRLRFDFSWGHALDDRELNGVERLANAWIHTATTVFADTVPLEQAKQINGVRAVFGERYPDPVRVVSIGVAISELLARPDNPRWLEHSIEFCGGTHLQTTDAARKLVIVSEQALAAGVRRITALTGPAALAADAAGRELESRAFKAGALKGEDLVEEVAELTRLVDELSVGAVARHHVNTRLDELRPRVRDIRKQSQASAKEIVIEQARTLAESTNGQVLVDELLGADQETLRAAIDVLRAKRPGTAVMFFTSDHEAGKVAIVARVPDELIRKGLKAGDWVRGAAQACGGGGGGRPDMAQAGGRDPDAIADAIKGARAFAEKALS